MVVHIGSTAPDFTQESTKGTIRFHEWIGDRWVMLFSFPHDFTPVCTSELGVVAKLRPEFDKRNCKVMGLSVDNVESHRRWIENVKQTQHVEIEFPIVGDADFKVSRLYDLIHPEANEKATVRAVLIIDPTKKVRLSMYYPESTGRNFRELLRAIDALQLADKYSVLTPADWQEGDQALIP